MLSQTQFFFLGHNPSTYALQMYKMTFSSNSVDWANKISWSFGSWTSYLSESLLSNDGSTIYIFFTYGSSRYLYFISLSVSTGTAVGSRYKSSTIITSVNSAALNGNYLLASTSTEDSVIMYNLLSSSFTIKSFSSTIYGWSVELYSGRFIIAGSTSSKIGYLSKFIPQSIDENTDLTEGLYSMNVLSDGTDAIISESGITIGATYVETLTSFSYTIENPTYFQYSSSTSDVYYQLSDQLISVIESSTLSKTLDLVCSSSGSTTITYSTSNFGSTTIPSWITFDSSTGTLSIIAPSIDANTEFDFYIDSIISGSASTFKKIIKLVVINWAASNCQKCTTSSGSTCETWLSGFTLTSGTWVDSSTPHSASSTSSTQDGASIKAKAIGIFILSIIIATLFVAATLSYSNSSSMWSFWLMASQMQMLILVFLSRSITSLDVRKVLNTSDFTMNIYHYIYLTNMKFYDSAFSNVKFSLTRQSLKDVGLLSDSSVYNLYPVLTCVLFIALIHFIMFLVMKQLMKVSTSSKFYRFIKPFRSIFWKLNKIMTFEFYIRNLFLMCQFILICSVYEVFNNSAYGADQVASLTFAYIMMLFYVTIAILILILSLTSFNNINQSKSKLNQFFCFLKESRVYRLYAPVFIIRRAFYIFLLVGPTSISSEIAIGIITVLQFCYLAFTVLLRPFK